MALTDVFDGDTGLVARTKINAGFTAIETPLFGHVDASNNTNTTILSASDTYVEIDSGTPILVFGPNFTLIGGGLRYDGVDTKRVAFNIAMAAERSGGGNAVIYEIAVFNNGLAGVQVSVDFPIEIRAESSAFSFVGSLDIANGDILDIFVRGVGHSNNIDVTTSTLLVTG